MPILSQHLIIDRVQAPRSLMVRGDLFLSLDYYHTVNTTPEILKSRGFSRQKRSIPRTPSHLPMALTLFWILAASPLLASALPPTAPRVGVSIPLSKRTPQFSVDGVVDRDFLNAQVIKVHKYVDMLYFTPHRLIAMFRSKVARGFAAYERNTGKAHPSNTKHITRRSTGADALQDDSEVLWQGTVEVGTPAVKFTGKNQDTSAGATSMLIT